MDWLSEGREILGDFPVRISAARQTIVTLQKVNMADLEVCHPKMLIRERSFWRSDKVDFYHLLPDGSIKHTPGD